MKREKEILLAYFDILGVSNKLQRGEFQEVYDFYLNMVELCSDSEIPMLIPNHLAQLNSIPELSHMIGDQQTPFSILLLPLKHAFFSDTFIVWVEHDDFLQASLDGFAEKVNIIFCEALKRKIPLRGIVSRGKAIMDEDNQLYLGMPLVEAAKKESVQEWLGISFGNACKGSWFRNLRDTSIPYSDHVKEGKKDEISGLVLDWPKWWRDHEATSAVDIIETMNTIPEYSRYYEKTIAFVYHSEYEE